MKKVIAALSAIALCAVPNAGDYTGTLNNNEVVADSITVVSYDDLPCNSIATATQCSYSDMWEYTMMYDRLLDYNGYGGIKPALAESWELVSSSSDNGRSNAIAESKIALNRAVALQAATAVEYPTDLLYAYDPAWWSERDEDMPDPEDITDWSQWGYESDISGDEQYFDGPGQMGVKITLRDDIKFIDGESLTRDSIVNVIKYAQKNSSPDALIHKQWKPVDSIDIDSDLTFTLWFDGSSSYGFIDFMLSLASPIASIFMVPDEYVLGDEPDVLPDDYMPIGTGAYALSDYAENEYMDLERNDGWWGSNADENDEEDAHGVPPTQYITLKPYKDNAILDLAVGESDLVFDSVSNLYYSGLWETYAYKDFSLNPIILQYNLDGLLRDNDLRYAVDLSINNREITYYSVFNNESYDYWSYCDRYDSNRAYDVLTGYGYDEYNPLELTMIVPEKFGEQVAVFQAIFTQYYPNDNLRISVHMLDEATYESYLRAGNYDIAYREIELTDINSVYNTLRYIDDDTCVNLLDKARRSANAYTNFASYYRVQQYCYANAYFGYLGWETCVAAEGEGVMGLDKPTGIYPISDMSRLDLRWIYKTIG